MIDRILNINQGDSGKAPHKPLLLLALIELVDKGLVAENKFPITEELNRTFRKLSAELVGKRKTPLVLHLPYYHLQNDGFWHLQKFYGKEVKLSNNSPSGLSSLKTAVDYAYLDENIFKMLKMRETRQQIKELLLLTYFPKAYSNTDIIDFQQKVYLQEIEQEFFNYDVAEPSDSFSYRKVRDRKHYFQTKVPFFYDYVCAISGLSVTNVPAGRLVDACHIKPIKHLGPNAIQNGISLTPTLHRAFDRHLISINEDYKVIVSKAFKEDSASPYNLSQFEGRRIHLPEKVEWYPSQEALEWHRSRLLSKAQSTLTN